MSATLAKIANWRAILARDGRILWFLVRDASREQIENFLRHSRPLPVYGNAGFASSSDPRLATTQFPGVSTVQFYINASGALENRVVEYPIGILRGVTSITQFPARSLPLLIADVDEVSRILELDDYRPA